jgi:HEPN domain-containing protein
MNYYKLAEEPLEAAQDLKKLGRYRMSVSMSTLAIDMLLKSVLFRLDPINTLLTGHDQIGIFRFLEGKYPKPELRAVVKKSRKYFNDSRYSESENFKTFDKQLAEEFIDSANSIKDYVDNDCRASLDDLQKKYGKQFDKKPKG